MSNGWSYPVELRFEEGRFHAYSDQVPEAIASGATEEEALREMRLAFEAAIVGRMHDGLELEPPGEGTAAERYRVALPAQLAAKASVYSAWKRSGLTKAALGERVGRSDNEIRRILDPAYGTKLSQIEEAAAALGGRLVVSFEPV